MGSRKAKRQLDDDLKRDLDSIVHGTRDQLSKPARLYLQSLVDPRSAPPAKIPLPSGGGAPGQSRSIKLKAEGSFATGASGYGLLSIAAGLEGGNNIAGPYSDRVIGVATTSAYAGTDTSYLPTLFGTGMVPVNWSDAPYTAVSGNNDPTGLQWRLVSCAIYLQPRSAALSQAGTLYLHESSQHLPCGATLGQLKGMKRTRSVRAIRTGKEKGTEIVLNYHPRGRAYIKAGQQLLSDTAYAEIGAANSSAISNGGLHVIYDDASATHGLQIHYEIVACYELTGNRVQGKTPSLIDTRGVDLIFNAIGTKTMSGWLGSPHHAHAGYLARMWKVGKKLALPFLREAKDKGGAIGAIANEVMGSVL
jgi:hypothetical protein